MPRLFWEIALQQIVPGISFLSSFFCKEWKADRASGPSLPLLQPCYWNSHIPRALLHAASLSSLHAPEILSGRRGWEERLTAKRSQDYNTHASLPRIARRFSSEPWVSKHPNKLSGWEFKVTQDQQYWERHKPPLCTVQESLCIAAWRGRVGCCADFILAGFFYHSLCKYYSPTVPDPDMKSNKAKTAAH